MSSQENKLPNAISSIKSSVRQRIKASLFAGALLSGIASVTASAAIIPVVYVGVWDSVGAGNFGPDGAGISAGQKYVIALNYDTLSIVSNNVAVLDGAFNPTPNLMTTINLSAPGNSLNIYVPMEGLDTPGNPFIYEQNQSQHYPFGPNSPVPTLNFQNNTFIGDKNNIIGIEYEGDFAPGAGDNFIELFNTAAPNSLVVSMTAQVLNFGAGVASTDTDLNVSDPPQRLAEAVDLMVDAGPDIVYNAASLTQTATAVITQSNDLGAFRTDGEDFIDVSWTPAGTVSGNSNQVGIAASGLTMTTSTTTWAANAAEQMTGKADSDTTNVSYANAIPTLNASAAANGNDVDFIFDANDADLAVNTLIAGFEMLSFTALVDGTIDASIFFADLFSNGSFTYTMADLFAEFGSGPHNLSFFATDKAGAQATALFGLEITGNANPPSIPEPSAILLMFGGLILLWRKQSKRL